MELKYANFQNGHFVFQEKVNVVNSLQVATTINGYSSSLQSRVTWQKYALKDADEWYKVASASVKKKACHVGKYEKDAETLKAPRHDVVGLRRALYDALEHTMWDVL